MGSAVRLGAAARLARPAFLVVFIALIRLATIKGFDRRVAQELKKMCCHGEGNL